MTWATIMGRRAQRRFRTEVAFLLDGGVDFLMEDDWRSPWSDHPNRPRRRKPYGHGKQVWAAMEENSAAEQLICAVFLDALQEDLQAECADQQREHRALVQRRLRAAERPATVIEPKSSVPGVQRVIAELERRAHMPIEEHAGPRSVRAAGLKRRRLSAQSLSAQSLRRYRYHRMIHPCLDPVDERKLGIAAVGAGPRGLA